MAERGAKDEPIEIVLDGETLRVDDSKRRRSSVGPGGMDPRVGEGPVKASFTGFYVGEGQTQVHINLWKPFVGCALFVLLFVAAITAVIVSVVRWIMK